MRVRAATVVERDGPVIVDDLDLEGPADGQVLVRVVASGVCHSDLSAITGQIPMTPPMVLGHEAAGIVEDVGPGVTSVEEGDAVMLAFITACGRCRFCTVGKPNLCQVHWRTARGCLVDGTFPLTKNGVRYNLMSRIGTMADRIVVMENSVIRIPPDTPLHVAALVGCGVTTGVGSVLFTAKVEFGSSVVVIGAGGIGLNAIQGAVLAGAAKIIAVDVVPGKLEHAKEFGATHVVNGADGDPVEAVMELTDGEGADYAIEAIGNPRTVEQAFNMLAFAGTAVVIGIGSGDAKASIPIAMLPYGERRLIGSMYGSARMRVDMLRLLDLYKQGRLKLDELVTKTYPLDGAPEAFEDLKAGRNIRGLLQINDS
ncbi:MAG: Zn-dependent alcohol dehydrogenase [Candidatus Poribacteria bacterium]